MGNNTYLPLYVDMKEKQVLIIGGGAIARRRILILVDFQAQVTVVAQTVSEEIKALALDCENLKLLEKRYEPGMEDGFAFVFAATNDQVLNEQIYRGCREKNIPVNNASNQKQCDFFFPAVVQKDEMVIGISSGGRNHSGVRKLAAFLREQLK